MSKLFGIKCYINDSLGIEHHRKQIKFPRSKKKRIRKKFEKNLVNWKHWQTQKPVIFLGPSCFVMNSIAKLAIETKIAIDSSLTNYSAAKVDMEQTIKQIRKKQAEFL